MIDFSSGLFFIAEAGVNHDGKLEQAFKLCDVARDAGADAVKFQTWKPGEITGKFTKKVQYMQESSDDSRYEISASLALPYEQFEKISEYCQKIGIMFLSTPDGFESLDFLVDQLNIPIIKVGSSEVSHLQYLDAIGRKNRPTVLSTGVSTLAETATAYETVAAHCDKSIAVLHCTSEYPAPDNEMNISALTTIREALKVPVGLSDHSVGNEAPIAATALGAGVIEKHFTLDRSLPGPDHKASIGPEELKALIQSVKRVRAMMGDGRKRPMPSELANMPEIRRGVVAASDLKTGSKLAKSNLTCKRPFRGVEPSMLDAFVGMTLNRDLQEDEPILWDDVK